MQPDPTIAFLHSQGGEAPITIPAIGLDLVVRLPPSMSGGQLCVIETTNAPGFGPPLHRHREAEIFRVMHGTYMFQVDQQRFIAHEGDVVSVPGGAAHTFLNVTDRPAAQLILIVPGLDAAAFFTGLGDVMSSGIPDQKKLATFGEAWGVTFLGPPLHMTDVPAEWKSRVAR